MPYIKHLILLVAAVFLFSSCHEIETYPDSRQGNFEALWSAIDTHYCYLSEKGIDWQEVGSRYRTRIPEAKNDVQFFNLCADMLKELRDGHVNLVSDFNTFSYREWWTDYPQDFDLRTIQQHYLDFDWKTTSGIIYKTLPGGIGYIYYPSFSNTIGDLNLDYILASFGNCRALIIDIRNNGGGMLTNINTLVARFIDRKYTGAYITHKTGPGHDDFSSPYPIVYEPAAKGRVKWNRPVILLTNRSCYSAANCFAAVMSGLEKVTVIGARTGGGGGLPFSSELPNGWSVRFSASPVSDASHNNIEWGIEPTEGFEVHCTPEELAAGTDAILDRARAFALHFPLPG